MINYNNRRRIEIKTIYRFVFAAFLFIYMGMCHSLESMNVIFLPDPFSCHQVGVEFQTNDKNTLGLLGRLNCDSKRPTYGSKNADVDNKFSRLQVPWRYSFKDGFKSGFFVQALAGLEQSEFKSTLGSTAKVTFINIGFHGGYQWFWKNGINVSVLAGRAFLQEINSDKNIISGESQSVSNFLDKNTKTNNHGGFGVIVGWLF